MGFKAGDRAIYQCSDSDDDPVNGMTVTIEGPASSDWKREAYDVRFEPVFDDGDFQTEGVAWLEELTLVE